MLQRLLKTCKNAKDESGQRTKIKSLNLICLANVFLSLIFSYIGKDSTPYFINMLVLAGIFLMGLMFNYFQRTSLTEYFVPITTTIWIVEMSLGFGSALGTENYLMVALVGITLYYSKGFYRKICILVIIFLTVFVNLYEKYNPPFYELPQATDFLYIGNVLTPYLIICFICWNVIEEALQHQSVIQIQKEILLDSVRFKDKVFSIIGHDLKAPFYNTKSMMELIENDTLSQQERKVFFKRLHKSIDASVQTLDNLLTWSSKSYGVKLNARSNREKLELHAMVEQVMLFFDLIASNKKIELINSIQSGTYIRADREQVLFVLRNLTNNALKFSFEGQSIIYSADASDPKVVEVSIKDQGTGMTEVMIDSLFQVTKRVSNVGTNKEKGSGLGLLFCKDFIENNEGKIWIESEPERGTTAKFTIAKPS